MTYPAAQRIAARVGEAHGLSTPVTRRLAIAGATISIAAEPAVEDVFFAPFDHLALEGETGGPRASRARACESDDDGAALEGETGGPRASRARAREADGDGAPLEGDPRGPRASRARACEADDLRIFVAAMTDDDRASVDALPDSGIVHSEGASIVHLHRDTAAVLDRDAGTIHALVRADGGVASWIRAKPLQMLLSVFFSERGVDLLHGGLVARNGHALLVAGNGGTGKSTLAIASVLAGLDYLADDCAAVSGTDGYSIYGSGCILPGHLASFGLTAPEATAEKSVLPIAKMFPERMATHAQIRAIVLPRVTHANVVSVHRATGRDALLALAPGSILKRAVPAAGMMSRMAKLAASVPVFRLEMGPVAEAGRTMVSLLEEVSR